MRPERQRKELRQNFFFGDIALMAEEIFPRVHFCPQVSTVGTWLQANMLPFSFPWEYTWQAIKDR